MHLLATMTQHWWSSLQSTAKIKNSEAATQRWGGIWFSVLSCLGNFSVSIELKGCHPFINVPRSVIHRLKALKSTTGSRSSLSKLLALSHWLSPTRHWKSRRGWGEQHIALLYLLLRHLSNISLYWKLVPCLGQRTRIHGRVNILPYKLTRQMS